MSDKKYAYWNSVNTTTDSPWNLVVIAESAYLRGSVALCSKRYCALEWKNFLLYLAHIARRFIYVLWTTYKRLIYWMIGWLIDCEEKNIWEVKKVVVVNKIHGWPFLNETLD